MLHSKQQIRRAEIERVALDLIAERGFNSASMLSISKHAKSSNDTLYRWYGSKAGLLHHLVKRFRLEIQKELTVIAGESLNSKALTDMGAALLERLLSRDGVALHRALVVNQDGFGADGAAASSPKQIVDESITCLFIGPAQSILGVGVTKRQKEEAVEAYLSLLIGDLLMRRAVGEHVELTKKQITHRAQRAMECAQRNSR